MTTPTQVWRPGEGWTPSRYTAAEEAWMARTLAAKADDRRPAYRTVRRRMNGLLDSWLREAGQTVAGLTMATATIPPPASPGDRVRGPSGPSDPTGTVLSATWATVDRAAVRFAHLTGPCLLSGSTSHDRCCGRVVQPGCKGNVHDCGNVSGSRMVDMFAIALPHGQQVDALVGTPPSARRFATRVVPQVGTWHAQAVGAVAAEFDRWWHDGAEPHELEAAVHEAERLVRGFRSLAGSLAGWSGRQERQCAAPGCAGAAPPVGEGATCQACRKRKSRAMQEGAA